MAGRHLHGQTAPAARRLLLFELLDASAILWNELTYECRQAFFETCDIWQIDVEEYRVRYKGILGSATAQHSSGRTMRPGGRSSRSSRPTRIPRPPGYWKDEGERDLQTLIRNDQYTLSWGARSRLEIPVGFELEEKYGLCYHERLRLEARGDPRWNAKQGRMDMVE